MEFFGLRITPQKMKLGSIDCLPPKIWRAVMLDIYNLPVTPYIVRDLRTTSLSEIKSAFSKSLQRVSAGIVVRTIGKDDDKATPYFWIKKRGELKDVVTQLIQSGQQYFIAFAPKAVPNAAKGFVVGRYILGQTSRTLEIVADAIEPRRLEQAGRNDPDYGWAERGCGQVSFRTIKYPKGRPHLCCNIVKELFWHEDKLCLLQEELVNKGLIDPSCGIFCVEFTFLTSNNALEFHDFDLSFHK